jgi:hypothetical protein
VAVLSADTDPRAEAVMVEILRRMTPTQRLRRSFELRHSVLRLARSRILREHPNASPREVRLRLASLWLDAETMRRVWGWDPEIEGF